MKSETQFFKAVANERRATILRLLKKKGSLSVGELASLLGLSFKSTSKHCVILHHADLVVRRQVSLEMIYDVNTKHPFFRKSLASLLEL